MLLTSLKSVAAVAAVVFTCQASNTVERNTFADQSWIQECPSIDCVFVHIPPLSLSEELAESNPDPQQSIFVRSRFKQTGLYSNDEPPRLLWQCSLKWMTPVVFVCSDKEHAIVPGAFTEERHPEVTDVVAIFLEEGTPKRIVRYEDVSCFTTLKRWLVKNRRLAADSLEYDEKLQQVVLKTNVGERYVFDGLTGEVIEASDPVGGTLLLGITTLLLVLGGMFIRVLHKSCRVPWSRAGGTDEP